MTWRDINSRCDEASKIRWECVPYFHGRILDVGCGEFKTFPHWIGVDNGSVWGTNNIDVVVEDGANLDVFASRSCDGVFSSHLLEHFHYEQVPAVLQEWFRVIKTGGHLMLYLPDEDDYPKVGEKGANKDHKWNVNYNKVVEVLEQVPYSWDMIDFQNRNEGNEYSLYFVVRKL